MKFIPLTINLFEYFKQKKSFDYAKDEILLQIEMPQNNKVY